MENKTPESYTLIRFPDCDPFNHLNNSRYIDYFMNAREDHLVSAYGLNIYEFAMKTGKTWVVARNQIVYIQPALLMEKVWIQTTVREWGERDIFVEMRMWNADKTVLKSLLWARFVHFDLKTQKAIPHDEDLNKKYGVLANPFPDRVSFDDRVKQTRTMRYDEF